MSPPAYQRAERIARDVRIAPHVAPQPRGADGAARRPHHPAKLVVVSAGSVDFPVQSLQDFNFIIPEGWLRIARRFNAGTSVTGGQVPQGRLKSSRSADPPGLIPHEPQTRRSNAGLLSFVPPGQKQ